MTILNTGEDNCQRQMPTLTCSSLWGPGRATEPSCVGVEVMCQAVGRGWYTAGWDWMGECQKVPLRVCVCVCVCVKERLGPELLGHPTSKSYVGII